MRNAVDSWGMTAPPTQTQRDAYAYAAAEFEKADPSTPVVPALHMVSVVAQADPGTTGKYRTITSDEKVQMVYDWAREAGAIFIVDIQVGQDDIRNTACIDIVEEPLQVERRDRLVGREMSRPVRICPSVCSTTRSTMPE